MLGVALHTSCSAPEPVKIGFTGSLSGRNAELSQSVRDGVLILANSIDTALYSQQLDKLSGTLPKMGNDWSFSGHLVRYGRCSVEGLAFTPNLDMQSQEPRGIALL